MHTALCDDYSEPWPDLSAWWDRLIRSIEEVCEGEFGLLDPENCTVRTHSYMCSVSN